MVADCEGVPIMYRNKTDRQLPICYEELRTLYFRDRQALVQFCVLQRSPCEEQDIKHVEERKMSSIRLNCFLRVSSVNSTTDSQGVFMDPQKEISNLAYQNSYRKSGRVDYAIKKNNRWFIRRNNLHTGPNLMQCKSSCDMNLNMLKKSGRRTRRSTMSMDMYMALSRQQLVDISSFTALNAFSVRAKLNIEFH
ncbi:uncharacterized protein OCT59_017375 [Rhizophagus irregularis]|uniref:uncharacterized protein n=1 Tax=Rhizophagus irregularis TaxID=588596 RepID=UPI00333247A9|nr:hypothetical protein OCT59_017375 [Rhizophagus irregularis]